MKRIDVFVALALMMFLVQCKPNDEFIEQEEGCMVKLHGDVEMPYSRALFDSKGHLEWSTKDKLYLFNLRFYEPHYMKNSATSQYPGHLNFACYYNQSPMADYLKRNIYYVGGTTQRKDSLIYRDLRNQTGEMSNIGNTIMGKMTVMAQKTETGTYHYERTTLGVITSVIRIDLPEMECEKYYLDYEGCYNYFEARFTRKVAAVHPDDPTKTVDDMQNKETYYPGRVGVSGTTKDTYIVVFPQSEPIPNTVVSIYADDEEIGSVVFPNGIRSNKLYVAEGGGSIKINGRSKVLEDDLFTTRE